MVVADLCGQVSQPVVGHIANSHGEVRKVLGIPGAFVLGELEQSDVLAMACSEVLCVAKTDAGIVADGINIAAPAGPAVIAVEGDRALLYFPSSHELAFLSNGKLTTETLVVSGEVVALRAGPEIAVQDGQTVRVMNRDQAVVDVVESDGPVALFPGGLAYVKNGEVHLRHRDGRDRAFVIGGVQEGGVQEFFRPSAEFLGVRCAGGTFLIRLTEGREEMWQLPEAEQ